MARSNCALAASLQTPAWVRWLRSFTPRGGWVSERPAVSRLYRTGDGASPGQWSVVSGQWSVVSGQAVRQRPVQISRGGLGPARLRRIRELVHARLEGELSLEELAQSVGLSTAH